MSKAREVFDELFKNENRFSHAEVEDIWNIFTEARGNDIEAHMICYFSDALMCLDDKSLIEMMNKMFDANRDSCHLFLTVEEYCNWVIKECKEWKKRFTPYDLQEIIMNIHDNFDDGDNDIFDDSVFIFQQNECVGDCDPCNIMPGDRDDVESELIEYLCYNDDAMSIALEYCDDDLMKLWYGCCDIIVLIYDKWQEKLEEMEEMEEEEEE